MLRIVKKKEVEIAATSINRQGNFQLELRMIETLQSINGHRLVMN